MENIEHCLIYLDDIISFHSSREEHLKSLKNIFLRLKEFGLKLNSAKCQFLKSSQIFGSYYVVKIDPDKVSDLKNMSAPKNVDEMQRFLSFIRFQRSFIKYLPSIAKPLTTSR